MLKASRFIRCFACVALIVLVGPWPLAAAPLASRDVSHEAARSGSAWVRDRVIYEINPLSHFYKYIVALRRAHPALRQGETAWLHNSDETRLVTYLRKAGHEECLVAINLTNRPLAGTADIANGEEFREVTPDLGSAAYPSVSKNTEAFRSLALDSWGFRIFQREVR